MGILTFLNNNKIQDRSFEAQLDTFEKLGFKINNGIDINKVIDDWGGKQKFEDEPYSLLYQALGSALEGLKETPVTDHLWHFDTEAIENIGDYVRILENIKRISADELNFINIRDSVDLEKEKASVSFHLNKEQYSWDLKVDGDWVDSSLFSGIVQLTHRYQTDGKLTYYSTGGQDLVLGWATNAQFKGLRTSTGLKVEWLR